MKRTLTRMVAEFIGGENQIKFCGEDTQAEENQNTRLTLARIYCFLPAQPRDFDSIESLMPTKLKRLPTFEISKQTGTKLTHDHKVKAY